MAVIKLVRSGLKSYGVRRKIGSNGIRKIASNYSASSVASKQGFFGKIWQQLKGLGGWIGDKLAQSGGIRNISFSKIWDWVTSGFNTLWSFNWQQTDADIDKQLQAMWQQLTVRMAGITGRAFGYLVCGAVPAMSMAVINKPLAVFLLKELGEEAISDLGNELNAFLQESARAAMNAGALVAFKNVRKWIKKANKNPQIRGMVSTFINPKIIDQWGEEQGKEWSFQSEFQRRVEKLPEPWQDRVEEFVDEFSDACIEAGYVIAGGLDEWIGMNAATQNDFSPFGRERQFTFYPDKDVKSEKFIIRGKEQFVKSQVIDIVNQKQLLDNREITLSLPTEEWGRIPVTENNGIEVEFHFYKYEKPPYWTKERRRNNGRQRIRLTNVKKSSLTWKKIKKAWGDKGFVNGKILTVITWQNGRKTKLYTQSENEGERIAQILAEFSESEIVFPIIHIAKKGHEYGISGNTIAQQHRQYLSYIKIYNWEKITKFERSIGKTEKLNRKQLVKKLDVYQDQEPSWWKEDLQEILSSKVETR